jgi:hypothetical protein
VAQLPRVGTLCAPTSGMSQIRTFIVEDSPLILEHLVATLEEIGGELAKMKADYSSRVHKETCSGNFFPLICLRQ